jgi:ubiquinone/menaquinone biosynthesis C-methylase UbiE
MTTPAEKPTYVLGYTEAETRRLIVQSDLYGRATRLLLEEAGIGPGMRVLDVGSGAGDVALLAAGLVHPGGSVLGIDSNQAVLETARARASAASLDSVAFAVGDLRELTLDTNFDALIGRLVLSHLPHPEVALRSLVEHLKPGGVVAFEEPDHKLLEAYANSQLCGPWRRKRVDWALQLFRRIGIHLSTGFGLRALFEQAGLETVDMFVYTPIGGSDDWAGYEQQAQGYRSLLPQMEKFGIATQHEVDADNFQADMHAEMIATGVPAMLTPHVCAWARKPI